MALCVNLGSKSPEDGLLSQQTSLPNHKFKDKIITEFQDISHKALNPKARIHRLGHNIFILCRKYDLCNGPYYMLSGHQDIGQTA